MKIKILILLSFSSVLVLAIFYMPLMEHSPKQSNFQHLYAILPHFMIETSKIDEFYSLIKSKVGVPNQDLSIILISPNHFGLGKKNIEGFPEAFSKVCFGQSCLPVHSLGTDLVGTGKSDFRYFDTRDLFQKTQDGRTTKEHGIGEHFAFLSKYFSGSSIYPVVMKPGRFADIDTFVQYLDTFCTNKNCLILASVDFSHYTDENFAKLHDRKTLYTLGNPSLDGFKNIEVDCPTCLYTLSSLAKMDNQCPNLFYRDSSNQILASNNPLQNTSRDFVMYNKDFTDVQNGVTLGFFGDLIYDRGVKTVLNSELKLQKYFSGFYQQGDINKNPQNNKHRKLFGMDFAGFNLENPIVDSKDCKTTKDKITFCGDKSILPILKLIGFNLVNISNNHILDQGMTGYENTKKVLKDNGFNFFGTISSGGKIIESNIFTGVVRDRKVAFHGFNFVNESSFDENYCQQLASFKKDGYINFVSVHWGNEYLSYHDFVQQSIGHRLVDCGGDVIIGHHPHVLQDIERYKSKPIIYSLGNFLFDQDFSAQTKFGGYALIDYQSGDINLWTGQISSFPK